MGKLAASKYLSYRFRRSKASHRPRTRIVYPASLSQIIPREIAEIYFHLYMYIYIYFDSALKHIGQPSLHRDEHVSRIYIYIYQVA